MPALRLGLPFIPTRSTKAYLSWPELPEIFPISFPGVKTSRDSVVIDVDKDRLISRMKSYFDPDLSNEEIRRIAPEAMQSTKGFAAEHVRLVLLKKRFLPGNVIRYCYRPFDFRWLYWEPDVGLLDRARAEYLPHVFDGNVWLEARQKQTKDAFDRGYFVRDFADNFGNGLSSFFPLYLNKEAFTNRSFDEGSGNTLTNLSPRATAYLKAIRAAAAASKLFFSTLAVLQSSAYRTENRSALRLGWPRIPLPQSKDSLKQSASLGAKIAALLDAERPLKGVTTGKLRPLMPTIATPCGELERPEDFKVSVGWGRAGKNDVTMPGAGRVRVRDYSKNERAAIVAEAAELGLDIARALTLLGERTCDIALNDGAWWSNIPANVWEYTIGGYQVIKKWLSYREFAILGRPVKHEEVSEVMNMARRIAAILLMQPELDSNYESIKHNSYSW